MQMDALQLLCDNMRDADILVRKLARDYPTDQFDESTWEMIDAVASTVQRFRELTCTNIS